MVEKRRRFAMIEDKDIFDGIIGGDIWSERHFRTDLVEPENIEIRSELDRTIVRLMTLHPNLVSFRNNNLSGLDEPTKATLLEDMYEVLGVTPLRNG
jgi:hypothetical protein